MDRGGAGLALVLAVALVAGAVPVSAVAPTTAQQQSIDVDHGVALTPDSPGEVRVDTGFSIPDDVTSLSVTVPEGSTVVATDGFVHRSGRTYDWTGEETPSLTYRLAVNETARGGEGGRRRGYFFVDAGAWAIARAPRLDLTYSGYGGRPSVERSVTADGAGVAGPSIVYLGAHERHVRTAAGQRFVLVVPARAEMAESPDAVLDSMAAAATAVDAGDRDDRVLVIAAPTTVDWGSTGLQLGDRDLWVRDVQRLDTPNNVWLHEYVHTRQDYRTTAATRWTTEGFVEYYAALLTLRQGRIDYERFRDHLARGAESPYADAVLAEPSTWDAGANYWKGALVAGAVDYRLRRSAASLDGVLRRMNGAGRLNQSEFLAAVEAAGDGGVRSFARTHTETDAVPGTWSRAAHAEAFGGLPAFDYAFVGYRVTGPYRNGTFERPPTLVPGETLHVRARVTNTGEASGDYEARLTAGDGTVGVERGSLAPGESATLAYAWSPDSTGTRTLALGDAAVTVGIAAPADPAVERLRAPETVAPGEAFAVQVTVGNPADRPARGEVVVRADGEAVARETVRLAPGEETTVEATVRFEDAGEHAVSAGDERATVRVGSAGTAPLASATPSHTVADRAGNSAPGTPTVGSGPGFGAAVAVVALALAVLLARA